MNRLYKGLEPQPDTFYKCINFYSDDGIEYCTPDGSTLVFAKDTLEIPYPFPDVYVFTQVYDRQSRIPPEAIPREVSVCDRMSVCWMWSSEFGMLMLVYPQGMNHSVLEKGYGKEFRFMYSLADFDALCLEYCTVTGLGSLTRIGPTCWFTPDSCTVAMHKLIPDDFFGGPELYREYGISDRELDEFFDCGEFHPWEDIEKDHCFYQYGDFIIYVSSRKDLAEGRTPSLWFECSGSYNAYLYLEDCSDMVPALAKPIEGKVNVGLYECSKGSYNFALTLEPCTGKKGSMVYNVYDLLTELSDAEVRGWIDLPICWFFLGDDGGVQLVYWRDITTSGYSSTRELLDMLLFE